MKVHFGEICYRQVEPQFDYAHCDSQIEHSPRLPDRQGSLQISIFKINFTGRL